MDKIVTEKRVDDFISWLDRHSQKMAIITLSAAVSYIILPALYKIFMG